MASFMSRSSCCPSGVTEAGWEHGMGPWSLRKRCVNEPRVHYRPKHLQCDYFCRNMKNCVGYAMLSEEGEKAAE